MSRTLESYEYYEPKTLEEAASLLTRFGKKAAILSGGTDLLVLMKKRVRQPEHLINIMKIPNLNHIKYDNKDGLRMGCSVTIRAIEKSEIIREKCPILSEAAYNLGSVQIRNMATLGSNLCRASPSSEMAPPLLVLNANARIFGSSSERVVPLQEFFVGPSVTVLKPEELLVQIQTPCLPAHAGTAFLKIARTSMDLAKVNVAVSLTLSNGTFEDAKIALGAVAPTPMRARKAEEILRGKKPEEGTIAEAAEVAAEEAKPINDIRSTASYRGEVIKVLVRLAVKKALKRVK